MSKVKLQKSCQRSSTAHTDDIDAAGVNDFLNCFIKIFGIQFFHSVFYAFHIHRQNLCNNVVSANLIVGDLHSLHRGQTIADDFLQSLLQLRITVTADFGGKTDHSRFADSNGRSQFGSSHESSFFIMFKDIVSDSFLSFGKLR